MSEWISVKEGLPFFIKPKLSREVYHSENVLVSDEEDGIFVACYSSLETWSVICNCREGSGLYHVTHWMPLPEAPNSSSQD